MQAIQIYCLHEKNNHDCFFFRANNTFVLLEKFVNFFVSTSSNIEKRSAFDFPLSKVPIRAATRRGCPRAFKSPFRNKRSLLCRGYVALTLAILALLRRILNTMENLSDLGYFLCYNTYMSFKYIYFFNVAYVTVLNQLIRTVDRDDFPGTK